jgi:hypothetical protein
MTAALIRPRRSQDGRGRKEPPSGFEPETPILPRWCATTAPQRQKTPGGSRAPFPIIGRPPRKLEGDLGPGLRVRRSGRSRIRTCVASATILQTVPFSHSGIRPRSHWSRREESNPQPTVYKTVALPLSYVGKPRPTGTSIAALPARCNPETRRLAECHPRASLLSASTSLRINAGVVPQHPPMKSTPASTSALAVSVNCSGVMG